MIGRVIVFSINVRNGIGVHNPVVSRLIYGNIVDILEIKQDLSGNDWGKIGNDKWVCMKFGNSVYINTYSNHVQNNSGLVTKIKIPATGDFYRVRHDFERIDLNYTPRSITRKTRMALPETVPMWNHKEEFFPFNLSWQKFWFSLMSKATGNSFSEDNLKKAWKSMIEDLRYNTDNHAPENGYADYITGRNIGAKPFEVKSLITGGNIVKVLAINGRDYKIETLDFSKTPPNVNDIWDSKFWLYHWATSETVELISKGKWWVVPFPQLSPFGMPVPTGSLNGYQIIKKEHLTERLTNGKEYPIYVGY